MDNLFKQEILFETLKLALDDLGLDDEDIDVVAKTLIPLAQDDSSFVEKFNHTLTAESYHTAATPKDPLVVGHVPSTIIPKLALPVFSFRRNTKPSVQLKAILSAESIRFFNLHYSDELTLSYNNVMSHDHPAAAMSRKIEYDYLMKYVWDKYCNPLLLPINYDFSVIDVGGDWITTLNRKQYGMHICNPLLDPRDRARDVRRRARDNTDFNISGYVCHCTFQECTKTAPVAISVHSSYDISPEDIITTMSKRGIANYVGSMFLPENIESVDKYADKDYGYNMYVDKTAGHFEKILDKFSKRANKYRSLNKTLVVFTFPNGESKEYCHDLKNLLRYSKNHTYALKCKTDVIHFDYKILRRVGSLIYFEFTQNFELPPVNQKISESVQSPPFDGYRVRLESSFLKSSILQVGLPNYVYVPRGLFDTAANYCLTRVSSEDFTVEHAITYVRSIMSSLQINESILSLHDNDDSFNLMLACGLASYQWAHERYRLLESRLPYKKFIEQYMNKSDSILQICNKIIDVERVSSDVKGVVNRVASSIISDIFMDNPTFQRRLENAVNVLSQITSPCIDEIVDMHLMVMPIVISEPDKLIDRRTSDSTINVFNLERVLPTYADYDQTVISSAYKRSTTASKYIEAKTLIDDIISKRFAGINDELDTLRPSAYEIDPREAEDINNLNDGNDSNTESFDEIVREDTVETPAPIHNVHVTSVLDFIRLACETDEQQLDQARLVVDKAIMDDNLVHSLLPLQADQKCKPFVISVVNGRVIAANTLEGKYHLHTHQFEEKLMPYVNLKFCTKLMNFETKEHEFKILDLVNENGLYVKSNNLNVNVTFDAIYVPEIQMLLGHMYSALKRKIESSSMCRGTTTRTKLVNGVAGCGKTHMQVINYIDQLAAGNKPAIFSATNAAALQAKERLLQNGINVAEGSVSTVDSFLMHRTRWKDKFTHIYIDEALQLHSGKIFAILEILNPISLVGYGDERQITFINFSRLSEPRVNTSYEWQSRENVMTTRRIPKGERITWLCDPQLYGPDFITAKPTFDVIRPYAEVNGLDKVLSIEWLYDKAGLPLNAPLLILVYRADVANDLRMRMQVSRRIPDENSPHRMALATIGESQGEDVENSILLRLSTKEEALYTKDDQTIVALTRSSKRWGYLTVPSNFPSLLEKIVEKTSGRKLAKTI